MLMLKHAQASVGTLHRDMLVTNLKTIAHPWYLLRHLILRLINANSDETQHSMR